MNRKGIEFSKHLREGFDKKKNTVRQDIICEERGRNWISGVYFKHRVAVQTLIVLYSSYCTQERVSHSLLFINFLDSVSEIP